MVYFLDYFINELNWNFTLLSICLCSPFSVRPTTKRRLVLLSKFENFVNCFSFQKKEKGKKRVASASWCCVLVWTKKKRGKGRVVNLSHSSWYPINPPSPRHTTSAIGPDVKENKKKEKQEMLVRKLKAWRRKKRPRKVINHAADKQEDYPGTLSLAFMLYTPSAVVFVRILPETAGERERESQRLSSFFFLFPLPLYHARPWPWPLPPLPLLFLLYLYIVSWGPMFPSMFMGRVESSLSYLSGHLSFFFLLLHSLFLLSFFLSTASFFSFSFSKTLLLSFSFKLKRVTLFLLSLLSRLLSLLLLLSHITVRWVS